MTDTTRFGNADFDNTNPDPATGDTDAPAQQEAQDGVIDGAHITGLDEAGLSQARTIVRGGGIIVVPTDTVYGVACSPFDTSAIAAVFHAKHRSRTKALQILLPSLDWLDRLDLHLSEPLRRLSDELLPGGFSPIATAGQDCRLATLRLTGDGGGASVRTQAIRVPDSAPLRRILEVTGPLAATSANISGRPPATSARQAALALGSSVALYLDAGPTPGPVASTVVEDDPADDDGIHVLREGVISESRLRGILES